jgi:hypothetical protein
VDFLEDHLRAKIADDIRFLELPPEWRPYEVLRYIVRKIEQGVQQDVKED